MIRQECTPPTRAGDTHPGDHGLEQRRLLRDDAPGRAGSLPGQHFGAQTKVDLRQHRVPLLAGRGVQQLLCWGRGWRLGREITGEGRCGPCEGRSGAGRACCMSVVLSESGVAGVAMLAISSGTLALIVSMYRCSSSSCEKSRRMASSTAATSPTASSSSRPASCFSFSTFAALRAGVICHARRDARERAAGLRGGAARRGRRVAAGCSFEPESQLSELALRVAALPQGARHVHDAVAEEHDDEEEAPGVGGGDEVGDQFGHREALSHQDNHDDDREYGEQSNVEL